MCVSVGGGGGFYVYPLPVNVSPRFGKAMITCPCTTLMLATIAEDITSRAFFSIFCVVLHLGREGAWCVVLLPAVSTFLNGGRWA